MNINSNMKEEIRVNIKKYLPIIIALFVVIFAAVLLLSSCKSKAVDSEPVIGEDGEVISEPKGDYDVWQYKTVTAKCGVDRQDGDVICTRVSNGDASPIKSLLSDNGSDGWELVDTLATGDVNTFIFKRLK